MPALVGAHECDGVPLLWRNRISLLGSLQRAQVTSRSTARGPGGSAWLEFPADQPRFAGSEQRLLLAGQRTNVIRNPRAEGAAAGTPGGQPTHWALLSTNAGGISRQIIGTGVEDGINYLAVRFFGTATSGGALFMSPEGSTTVAAAPGQSWTASAFLKLLAGSLSGLPSAALVMIERNASGTGVAESTVAVTPTGAALGSQRSAISRTLTEPTTAFNSLQYRFAVTNGATIDVTFAIGWPQLELGSFASTPILPMPGNPSASTRGGEVFVAATDGASLAANGPCTILWSGMLQQAAPAAHDQILFQIDDGTDAKRIWLRNPAGSTQLLAGRVSGGSAGDTAPLGNMAPGAALRVGLALDGAGRVSACLGGGTVQALSGAPTTGLALLRIGNSVAGATPMLGEVASVKVLPYAVPDAQLPARVAAMASGLD
jgi:hypothetical protein